MTTTFGYSLGRNKDDVHPTNHTATSFAELQDAILSARHTERNRDRMPYVARAFRANGAGQPYRAGEFALPSGWLGLDVDTLTPDAAVRLMPLLVRWECFWYATGRATAANLKRRVIVALSRTATIAEHPRIAVALEKFIGAKVGDGIKFDHGSDIDVARFWFLPLEDAPSGAFGGAPVDIERALAAIPAPEVAAARHAPDSALDADLRRAVLDGIEGEVYHALVKLSARYIGRGMGPDDAVASLRGLLADCAWHATNPRVWQERYDAVPGMVATAVRKFRRDQPATATATVIDDVFDHDDGPPELTVALARLPSDWVEVEQEPPKFIVEAMLPESEAGTMVGGGGTIKSTLFLYEAIHQILGVEIYGRQIVRAGPVLLVSKEDRGSLIDYRLKMLCRGLHLSDADMRRVRNGFLRLDLRGDPFALQRIGQDRQPFVPADVDQLIRTFRGEGIVRVGFDTVSRFGTGETNIEAKEIMRAIERVADAFCCAAEGIHHVSQSTAQYGVVSAHAGRGGTAFGDNGRFTRQIIRHTDRRLDGTETYPVPARLDPDGALFRLHITKLTGAPYEQHSPIWVERVSAWEFKTAQGAIGEVRDREDARQTRQTTRRSTQAAADDEAVMGYVLAGLERRPLVRCTANTLCGGRELIVAGMSDNRCREAVARLLQRSELEDRRLPNAAEITRGARTFLAPANWQEPLV